MFSPPGLTLNFASGVGPTQTRQAAPDESCMARRRTSVDHEETWLILAGFCPRPGFGAAADDLRIDKSWPE